LGVAGAEYSKPPDDTPFWGFDTQPQPPLTSQYYKFLWDELIPPGQYTARG